MASNDFIIIRWDQDHLDSSYILDQLIID